ncbi:MAG: glycosyl hydrolase [Saprospiraceae bacterium]|nr:MAG: glycosyl hydrolase [Saprospiraceae bacterium]
MKVSIIIPTLNEAENIERLIDRLEYYGGEHLQEIIVVDGGSEDETCYLAKGRGARVLKSPRKGRAAQMNYGVQHSSGDVLYFVHGDTLPPKSYMSDIEGALREEFISGIFRFRFESDRWVLKVNSWFTRFDQLWCRGGDQSIFVTREVFEDLGGYRDDYVIMEDYDFIIRTRKNYPFKIIQKDTVVSARKYETNGYFRVQTANLIVFNMYRLGFSQERLVNTYYRLLNYRYGRQPYK